MAKKRIKIPEDIQDKIIFLSDHTCCKCRERRKAVQIHHLDKDPSNNDWENLVLLCQQCHNEAHTPGYFSKSLSPGAIKQYRDDWYKRVDENRSSISSRQKIPAAEQKRLCIEERKLSELLYYLQQIPSIYIGQYKSTEPLRAGSTADMMNGGYAIVDTLSDILVELSSWIHPSYFAETRPDEFWEDKIKQLFIFHRCEIEKDYEGTITGPLVIGNVIHSLRQEIAETVKEILPNEQHFDYHDWLQKWELCD